METYSPTSITKTIPPHTYGIVDQVSLADCETIVHWIQEENKLHGHHMLEYTAKQLFQEANTHGCHCIKHHNKPIWFIKLMPVHKDGLTLFEWGSIFIQEQYRKQWLAQHLVQGILTQNPDLPIYSITNVLAVKKINQALWQYEYLATTTPKQILDVIESAGKLLDNDIMYSNEILHALIQEKS